MSAVVERAGAAGRVVLQVGVTILLVIAWERASRAGAIDPRDFGQPSRIWDALVEWQRDGILVHHIAATLRVLALGLGGGVVLGAAAGFVLGTSSLTRDICEPFVMFYNGMPRMILFPIVAIPLGFSTTSKVVLVVMVTWVIVALNVLAACEQLPTQLVANARMLGAGRIALWRDVYATTVVLAVLASARTTFQFAFATAVFAEFSGAPEGLGYLVVLAQQTFRIDEVMAALLVISAIGVVSNAALDLVERRVARWRPATR